MPKHWLNSRPDLLYKQEAFKAAMIQTEYKQDEQKVRANMCYNML